MKAVQANTVTLNQKLVLSLGFVGMFFSYQGIAVLAIPFYQMTLGVDPFLLSLAMTIPALLVCFLGPWVGQLSDRCSAKLGRRKPFILIFPWFSCILFGSMWMVPLDWTSQAQLLYFSLIAVGYYFLTMFWTVPLKCLAYEASQDYHERTEVMGFLNYFLKLSSIIYQWLFPLAQLSFFGGLIIGIQYVGWGVAFIFIGLLGMLPGVFIKERSYQPNQHHKKTNLFSSLNNILKIKNLRVLMLVIFIQSGIGVYAATMDYYLLVYMISGGDVAEGAFWKGVISTSYALIGLLAVVIVTKISAKLGKRVTLSYLFLLTFVGGLLKWFIYVPNIGWYIILDAVFCTFIWVGVGILIPAMVADLIDIDELNYNVRREGVFVSIQNWTIQISLAVAAIMSGFTLNVIGFEATLGAEQVSGTLLTMKLILVFGTAISALIGYFVINKYDFDEMKHLEVKKQLNNN